ncbi:TIR domain-containing protein [Bradyrhizobium diazoefficiens]|nr:TIR domain-containing protein [Bradyrhizobium diazoefficiens]MBR0778750.1 TIR domain-containing protein [Bradyrhizobium diazoefficiens]
MSAPMLEDVFKRSGLPTYTFVQPAEYDHLKVALRTAGRGVVVEGPSGIGKTTAVRKAASEMGLSEAALELSGRRARDVELIAELPNMGDLGMVIIDDFHRLPEPVKHSIAEFLKFLADNESPKTKMVLIGINKAGDSLVHFAADLNNRIDTIHFEVNDIGRVRELIKKDEEALQITISCAEELAEDAAGSFHIAQILCHELCLNAGITERPDKTTRIEIGLAVIKERVLAELARTFRDRCIEFARGRRFRREGRAPYLHLLLYLIKSDEWTVSIDQILASNAKIRGSLSQVVDKGHLTDFLNERTELRDLFHFDGYTRVLAVEDPKVMYFLRNLFWSKFVRDVGFLSVEYRSKYDFALSFAGEVRPIAEAIARILKENELEVFYDKDEQHRILAKDVESYLGPIYQSEARFVVALLSKEFPKKIWTKFESDNFKQRFGSDTVIPIWFADASPGMFDESARYGGLSIDLSKNVDASIQEICIALIMKAGEERQAEEGASRARDAAGVGAEE